MTVEWREVAKDLGLTEGPVWTSRGTLAVKSMSRGLVYEIDQAGVVQVLAETGGGPNGLAEGPDGTLWVAQNGGGHLATSSGRPVTPSIQRLCGGHAEDVITEGLESPNDCVFAPDGRRCFTDPRGNPFEGEQVAGRVCSLDVDSLDLRAVVDGPLYPNRLAFEPDGVDFYLAETATRRVLHAHYANGAIGPLSIFAQLPDGEPDGLTTDADGNVYVANAGGNSVYVFDRNGTLLRHHDVGNGQRVVATNLCFGGPVREMLYLTVLKSGSVLACPRREVILNADGHAGTIRVGRTEGPT